MTKLYVSYMLNLAILMSFILHRFLKPHHIEAETLKSRQERLGIFVLESSTDGPEKC
ncbi:17970_t:CDS:2 [Cetraspora pellucida]|uniref:17970_t:CDS:1 n=1 Tax=Cetraspora pellucida TaxID=1433469 RepID=A0A9N9FNQ6_9GLOM|nr:17970_t:CDS:2 [Cetraspora pellucida]